MRTVTITVGTGAQGVTIGRRAENEATAVIFDVSALIETYGDGGAVLMVKRPTDADAYPATVERSGTSVTWTPTDTDLAYKGMGEAELFWYVDGMLAKTAVYTINIRRDIGETTGEVPAPYDDWIATLTELGGQTAENAQRAEVARAAAETAAATATSAANTANTAAERAESAANNAEQDAASTAADRTAAEDAAARAATSATAAATSASAAATSAGQAAVSATSAAASATSAEQSASAAQSAVASIGDSVNRAESAATTAQSAATTASTKAAEANTSAGTAAQNATTATVKAQEAAQSATQAAQSATAAQDAQTAAETAQTAAETAQTAAESAAAQAEAEADRAEGYADRLIDVYPTDTASGAIASFPDGADDVPVKSLVVDIDPVQDLHGYDHPWPAGGGKNIFNINDATAHNNKVTLTFGADGSLTVKNENTYVVVPLVSIVMHIPIGTYTISASSMPDRNIAFYGSDDGTTWAWMANGLTRSVQSATVTTTKEYVRLSWQVDANETATLPPIQIESGSTPTAWTPYSNLCPITGWTGATVYASGADMSDPHTTLPITWQTEAGTVYGGTLTYDGDGVWTVTSNMVMADMGALGWQYQAGNTRFYSNTLMSSIVGGTSNVLSSMYVDGNTVTTNGTMQVAANGYLYVKNTAYTTAADFRAAMSGVQLCYEAQTTQTYTLTTEQVVNTILGQNNFWADCGDTSVTYRADIALYLDKKLAALAAALS